MSEYTFIDMFATKGPEYLVVIFFLLIVVPFWRLLNSQARPARAMAMVSDAARFFDPTHTWSFLDERGHVRIGIDNFLARLMGSARISTSITQGSRVQRGERLFTVEQAGKRIHIPAPVSGIVSAARSSNTSDLAAKQNWLVALKPDHWEKDQTYLMAGTSIGDWLRNETTRLRDFMAFTADKYNLQASPIALQDGGEIADNLLEDLSEEYWQEFQSEFIDAVMEL